MATFTVKVNTKDISNAVGDASVSINKYLENVVGRVVKRLAEEVAKPIAQSEFGYDGEVDVHTERTSNGYSIIAEGQQVCFLEFGAGVSTDPNHPFAGKVPFSVHAGSWSESPKGKKQFSTKGYWYYNKQRYEGIEPRRGLYEAYKAILQEADRITREELEK